MRPTIPRWKQAHKNGKISSLKVVPEARKKRCKDHVEIGNGQGLPLVLKILILKDFC